MFKRVDTELVLPALSLFAAIPPLNSLSSESLLDLSVGFLCISDSKISNAFLDYSKYNWMEAVIPTMHSTWLSSVKSLRQLVTPKIKF
ncbi:hypothetical protein M501DRAFT_1000105, partial [Patellaria atrata CBS 101060]